LIQLLISVQVGNTDLSMELRF